MYFKEHNIPTCFLPTVDRKKISQKSKIVNPTLKYSFITTWVLYSSKILILSQTLYFFMFNYNLVLDKEIHWYLLLLEYLLISIYCTMN